MSVIPYWKSHKVVQADKVVGSEGVNLGVDTYWLLEGGVKVPVGEALLDRVPIGVSFIGGYYVRYEDGFESWSPPGPFEKGYTRLDKPPTQGVTVPGIDASGKVGNIGGA